MDINLTSLTALYGAIVSSILLGWSIYRDLSDRGKLKVSCFIGKEVIPGVRISEESWLVYIITNTGKKSVYVTHIGGRQKRNNKEEKYTDFIISSFQRQKLEPGEEIVKTCELSVLNQPIKHLWAIDSLNKYYKISGKNLKNVIRESKKYQNESSHE